VPRPVVRPVVVVLCSGERPPAAQLEPLQELVELRHTDAEGLLDALADARALLHWDAPAGTLEGAWEHAARLEWVHVAAAGVDGLRFPGLSESSVVMTNARGVYDRPIAEFVLASVLARAKDVHRSHELQQAGVWEPRETRTVLGSTALVVGTGAIGRETARLLRAVGMQVRGAARRARDGDPDFDAVVASDEMPSTWAGLTTWWCWLR